MLWKLYHYVFLNSYRTSLHKISKQIKKTSRIIDLNWNNIQRYFYKVVYDKVKDQKERFYKWCIYNLIICVWIFNLFLPVY